MNNNMNNRGHFRHHNQFLHPDDAYYRQELSSTSANVTDENNLKGGFRLKLSNVRQFLLILLIWSLSVTILSLLIWLIVLPQFPLLNVIETSSGRLLGTLETRLGKRIVIYYGIPYARPPIGPRRFTRPEPSLPWKGVYKATTKPPSCYQFASDSPKNLLQSEDCLYLNLYVPLNEEDQQEDEEFQSSKINKSESNGLNEGFNGTASKPNKGKPVLVFIHSGGFMVGSINQYDPSILAVEGDVIVVTVGYRLGLFGFIYYELTGEPAHQQGNLGLYDQLLALQWIHANIQNFKGDPDNIVLFGDFAGAQSVGFHLISNRSQPYFKRAILLNGSPFNLALVMSRERSLNRTKALINATDCWSIDDNQTQNSSKAELPITSRSIDCLRYLKAPHLIQIDRSLYQKSKSSAMYLSYYPVAEESFFSSHPFELIESGDYGPQSEIMVGVNGHYESWMQDLGLTDFILNGMKLGSIEITPKMINRLTKFGPNIGQHYYEILTQVIMEDHSAVSPTDLAERINSLTLDMAFRCPNYFLVNSFIQNETRSVYYFELRASTGFELMNKMLTSLTNNDTSSKSTDVSMIFGYPLESIAEDGTGGYTEDDVAFSKIMMNHWVEFIKNGKPTSNDSWIPCKNEQQYYRYIIKKKGSILKSGFVENECDKYFRILYDIGKSIGKH